MGVVDGGLHATTVETACSVGASMAVASHGQFAVGLSHHTDFLRARTSGRLDVRAFPIHQGRVRLQNVALPS